jgi:hypothetical protein
MKPIQVASTAGILLFLGTTFSAYAQQDVQATKSKSDTQKNAGQPQKQQPQRQQSEKQRLLRQPAQHPRQPEPQRTQQARWQQQQGWLQQGGWQGHETWQEDRAQQWQSEHRTWAQRGGYGGYNIPQENFRLDFGSQHSFRIGSRPIMYQGYPRFEYGGFSFMIVDPWPENWAKNWYNTDDVYVGYDGGYYLYNRKYPQIGIAIIAL